MEAVTAPASGTGSKTMADLAAARRREARRTPPRSGTRSATSGVDISYAELGDAVSEIGRGPDRPRARARRQGLDPLPHPPRVDLRQLRRSSPPAPSRSRSTRPTPPRSATTCSSTPSRRPSSSRTPSSWRRSARSQGDLPNLEHIVIVRSRRRRRRRDPARRPARARRARATPPSSRRAPQRRHQGRHLHHDLHVGHHRPAQGLPAHPRQLPRRHLHDASRWASSRRATSSTSSCPLAHAFAKLIQFVALDLGGTIAYWEKDPQKIIPNLMEIKPTYFPSRAADVREDLHAGHLQRARTRSSSRRPCSSG